MEKEQIQNIKNLLQKVSAISKKYEEIAKITGENFNIFQVMNMQSDEVNLHSAFIAELLNPKGMHGQGDVFLKLFIEQFKIENFNTENAVAEAEKYIGAINEDYTEGGRIDIIIKGNEGKKIIIENKIYAEDQENQLLRYYNYAPDAYIYYLTLYGEEPSVYSIGNGSFKKENVKLLSYSDDIKKWLEKCKKEAVNFPGLRETITQYINIIKYLTGQTMNKTMNKEMVELILKDADNLKSAVKINQVILDAKIELQKRFWISLKEKIEEFMHDNQNIILKINETNITGENIKRFYTSGGEKYFYQGISLIINKIDDKHYIKLNIVNIYKYPTLSIAIVNKEGKEDHDEKNDFSDYLQYFKDVFKKEYSEKFQSGKENVLSGWIYTKFKHNFKDFNSEDVFNMTNEKYLKEKVDEFWKEIKEIIIEFQESIKKISN
ncbi:MAG: PD-(D/E)XK nuclease family protein [Bacteroidales bacterium]|nr:PD-(D/E)XK nuclease family protein [Bacteroidales bacterium]